MTLLSGGLSKGSVYLERGAARHILSLPRVMYERTVLVPRTEGKTMQPRMTSPALSVPGVGDALQALSKAALKAAVGPVTFNEAVKNINIINGPVWTYRTQLAYLSQHQAQLTALENGVHKSASQWKDWFWVCVGGMILFIPTIFLMKGRWSPIEARRDEEKHQEDVVRQLGELVGAPS